MSRETRKPCILFRFDDGYEPWEGSVISVTEAKEMFANLLAATLTENIRQKKTGRVPLPEISLEFMTTDEMANRDAY